MGRAKGPPPGTSPPALIFINSGIVHHTGIWRLHVRTARALAESGIASLRFDLSGIGDSENPRTAIPLDDLIRRDLDAAVSYVHEARGVDRVVMMGLCSGAWDSLDAAVRNSGIVGIVAVDLIADLRTWQFHLIHFKNRLFRLETWANVLTGKHPRIRAVFNGILRRDPAEEPPEAGSGPMLGVRPLLHRDRFREMVSVLQEREAEMLFLYSNGLEENFNHASQFAQAVPDLAAHPRVDTGFFPSADHTFSRRDQQQALIGRVVEWMAERFG